MPKILNFVKRHCQNYNFSINAVPKIRGILIQHKHYFNIKFLFFYLMPNARHHVYFYFGTWKVAYSFSSNLPSSELVSSQCRFKGGGV